MAKKTLAEPVIPGAHTNIMAIPSVPIVRIDQRQRDDILNNGFDPPGDDITAEVFCREIRHVCDRLQDRLSENWQYGIEDGDFFIHTSSEDDRMLCVEISKERIINDRLLDIAHSALMNVADEYCVDFCNDWFGLKLDSGQPHPDFNILVSKSLVSIYSECNDLLLRLGIANSLEKEIE